jgi:hypothetical protein
LEMGGVKQGSKYSVQSAPSSIVREQSAPSAAKSAERIEGAMIAGGDILGRKWSGKKGSFVNYLVMILKVLFEGRATCKDKCGGMIRLLSNAKMH